MTVDELARFDMRVPFVVGNPFMPHFPHPKQARLLSAHLEHDYRTDPICEILYGGAAGGGKSDALLDCAAQFAWRFPHFRAVLLRRTHTELAKAGALMSRAMQWWIPQKVHWDGTNKVFRFPGGATVEMGYHSHPTDDAKYQGGEWHLVGFDELTHWPDESALEWLRSRIRKGSDDPIPLRLYATSNPGSVGHVWVKSRFIGGYDLNTGVQVVPRSRCIRATIDDNPSLDREAYKETLRDMHPTRRAQLLEGDWSARDPGDYFRPEWFGPFLDPAESLGPHIAVRWWDLAASEAKTAARTAGVHMARLRAGVRVVRHVTAFRKTPGARDAAIVRQAHLDGRGVVVGIEIEGGSGGPAQFEALEKRLKAEGFRVVGARPKAELKNAQERKSKQLQRNPPSVGAKQRRADPVASCLERGYQRRGEHDDSGETWWGADADRPLQEQRDGLRLVLGSWTQGYIDEVEGFPDAALLDLVDATTGAYAWLEAHPFGLREAPRQKAQPAPVEAAGVHPEERIDPSLEGRNSAGHWRSN